MSSDLNNDNYINLKDINILLNDWNDNDSYSTLNNIIKNNWN